MAKGEILQPITYTEKNFLDYCKKLGYGNVRIDIKDGQPIQVLEGDQARKMNVVDSWELQEYIGDVEDGEITIFKKPNGKMIVKKIIKRKRFDIKPN